MKKVMIACCFLFGGFIAVNAQDSTSTSTPTQQYPTTTAQEDQDRERINSRDLPDAVKRSLEQTEYRGWLVNAAYKTTGVSQESTSGQVSSDSTTVQSDTASSSENTGAYGKDVFVVELKNGAQTKTVRFDKEGNKLDDDGVIDNDQD